MADEGENNAADQINDQPVEGANAEPTDELLNKDEDKAEA